MHAGQVRHEDIKHSATFFQQHITMLLKVFMMSECFALLETWWYVYLFQLQCCQTQNLQSKKGLKSCSSIESSFCFVLDMIGTKVLVSFNVVERKGNDP